MAEIYLCSLLIIVVDIIVVDIIDVIDVTGPVSIFIRHKNAR
ncbi:hypothetical protein [Colwellia sp. MB02u-9]|nr:hypothetical protein [Colwellia sp. MB02u-9]